MRKIIVLFVIINIILVACSGKSTISKLDKEEVEVYMEFRIDSIFFQELNLNYSYDSPLTGTIYIANGFPIEQEYGVMFLLNETQINYVVNGKTAKMHTFSIPANKYSIFSFETDILPRDSHTFIAVLVRSPHEDINPDNLCNPMSNFLAARYSFTTQETRPVSNSMVNIYNPEVIEGDVRSELAGLWVTLMDVKRNTESNRHPDIATKLDIRNCNNFNILYKNLYQIEKNNKMLLLAFIDYKQAPIYINNNKYDYVYFDYTPNTQIAITSASIDIKGENLFFLAIENPGGDVLENTIYFSNKIALTEEKF